MGEVRSEGIKKRIFNPSKLMTGGKGKKTQQSPATLGLKTLLGETLNTLLMRKEKPLYENNLKRAPRRKESERENHILQDQGKSRRMNRLLLDHLKERDGHIPKRTNWDTH